MMKEKLSLITGCVCKWETRAGVVQKQCGQLPCKQCLPAYAMCSQNDLAGSTGRRLPWSQCCQLLQLCKHLLAYYGVETAKQASSDNWGHCWHPTASELVICMDTLISPSSCKNVSSSHPLSRSKEGASPSPVPFLHLCGPAQSARPRDFRVRS